MKKSGFTLIELMVVIAIIAILSGIVLASLSSTRAKSRDSKRIGDISQLQLALELFYEACRQYPATLSTGASNGCPTSPSQVTLGTFIDPIPKDPKDPTYSYVYSVVPNTYSNYHLGATLEVVTNVDRDKNYTQDSGWSGTPFNGTNQTCLESHTGGVKCYDVTGQ